MDRKPPIRVLPGSDRRKEINIPGRVIIFVLAGALLLSESSFAADVKTVYIDIVGEGKFEVIYHRALSNATGAVIGGLIGAGIQSSIEAGKDANKTQELLPLIAKESWKTQFLDALNDKLESKGFEAVWVEKTGDIGGGIVLKLYPALYGFRMVDTSTHMVSAFVAFKASFGSGDRKDHGSEKEEYYITSKNQRPYDSLLLSESDVNSDLESTLKKAAERLANKIIYSVKE